MILSFQLAQSTVPLYHHRRCFYEACRNKAVSIVLVHNHPSGDSNPSRQDIEVTDKISKAGEILGIHLIDHIIIGDNNYTSLKEYGCIG